jgi:hypothetical protein
MSVSDGVAASETDIARLAHSIWESEGRPEGRDREHWQRARELLERDETAAHDLGTLREEPGVGFTKELAQASRQPGEDELTPGPRNPAPEPSANADGHAEVPSVEENAAGATSDNPRPPRARRG